MKNWEDKLLEYFDKVIEYFEKGADFTGEQIPLFISELLTYYTLFHSVRLILCIIIIVSALVFIRHIVNNTKNGDSFFYKANYDSNEHRVLPIIFSSIVFIISLALSISSLFNLIKVISAPRLVIIEQLMGLM